MDGPFEFRYKRNSKTSRPCYIVNCYESGLCNVYCPEIKVGEETFYGEFNLAKRMNDSEDSFVAFGKDNYLN